MSEPWKILRTNAFLKSLKKYKRDTELLENLDKVLIRLRENPENVGGKLSGKLHKKRSTRLLKKFRLIFSVHATEKKVYLEAIHHRKKAYSE